MRIALLVVFLVACGGPHGRGSAAEDSTGTNAETAHAAFAVKGSDTMVILTQMLAGAYMESHPNVAISVAGGGSGTGIAALLNGTAEIATSSRAVQAREAAQLNPLGLHENQVAIDALAIYVHQSNPLRAIELEELAAVYRGQTTSFATLRDATPNNTRPVVLYSRENNSGTYVYFKEHVLKRLDFAAEAQMLPGTAAVINAVAHDPNGIGYGGIGFANSVRLVPVRADRDSQAIAPNMTSARDGSYPLSRFLFMYTTERTSPAARAFVDWVRSPAGQAHIEASGFYPLGDLASNTANERQAS